MCVLAIGCGSEGNSHSLLFFFRIYSSKYLFNKNIKFYLEKFLILSDYISVSAWRK